MEIDECIVFLRWKPGRTWYIHQITCKVCECTKFFLIRPRKRIIFYVLFVTGPFRNPRFNAVFNKTRIKASSRGRGRKNAIHSPTLLEILWIYHVFLVRPRKNIVFGTLFVTGPFRNPRFNGVFSEMRVKNASSRRRGRKNAIHSPNFLQIWWMYRVF